MQAYTIAAITSASPHPVLAIGVYMPICFLHVFLVLNTSRSESNNNAAHATTITVPRGPPRVDLQRGHAEPHRGLLGVRLAVRLQRLAQLLRALRRGSHL